MGPLNLKMLLNLSEYIVQQTPIPQDGASSALQNFGQSAVNRSRSCNSAVEASRS